MRNWTVMVYMAGDNGKFFEGRKLMDDLQAYGWQNIADMSSVGSTEQVAVVVQFDTLDQQQYTPRLLIDGREPTGQLLEKIPPVNTGDPRNLTDFIIWSTSRYPAEHYALILWNHGTGWKEEDIYVRYRDRVERAMRGGETRSGGRGERVLRRAMFLETAAEIMSIEDDETRGICYDDTSMDFLDNRKLAQALQDARHESGCRLSVLGMDACLMSTIEVAYEIRDCADYMVGSQEVEEGFGWPYAKILGPLVQQPTTTPKELSRLIVEQFGEHYLGKSRDGGGINTQSAIDLGAISQTSAKIDCLASFLIDAYPSDLATEIAVRRARDHAQSFRDRDSLDLRHFAELLRDEYDGKLNAKQLADVVVEHLDTGNSGDTIVECFAGSQRPNASGLSIYFPHRGCSPFYARQAFAASGWKKVITVVNQLTDR